MIKDKNSLKDKKYVTNILYNNGSENPELEYKLIDELLINSNNLLIKEEIMNYLNMKIPIQYLSKYTYVKEKKIIVSEDTLIPGLEMNQAIDICSKYINSQDKVLELCTGCGGISIVLGDLYPNSIFYATDISLKAIEIAKMNINKYKLSNVSIFIGDMFNPLYDNKISGLDLIFANPPFCKTEDIDFLPDFLKLHTPRIAIDGGRNGLNFYEKIVQEAHVFLKDRGCIVFQHDYGQSLVLQQIFLKNNYKIVEIVKNHLDKEVFLVAQLN